MNKKLLVFSIIIILSGCASFICDAFISELEKSLYRPSYSPDGKYIILGIKENIFLMDRKTHKIIKKLTEDNGYSPSYSYDGKKIVYLKRSNLKLFEPIINSKVK